MTTNNNLAAVRRFWEGFNAHNLDIWDKVCASDFVNHDPGLPTPNADLPTIKRTIADLLFTAFPDMVSSEEDLIVEGNKVIVRRTLRGTHTGAFMGVAPTGKKIEVGGVWLAHLSDGKIQEQWVYFDALGMLQQVGALPVPKKAA
jgi:steroid delta-isomerase-like uncharacterized protein